MLAGAKSIVKLSFPVDIYSNAQIRSNITQIRQLYPGDEGTPPEVLETGNFQPRAAIFQVQNDIFGNSKSANPLAREFWGI